MGYLKRIWKGEAPLWIAFLLGLGVLLIAVFVAAQLVFGILWSSEGGSGKAVLFTAHGVWLGLGILFAAYVWRVSSKRSTLKKIVTRGIAVGLCVIIAIPLLALWSRIDAVREVSDTYQTCAKQYRAEHPEKSLDTLEAKRIIHSCVSYARCDKRVLRGCQDRGIDAAHCKTEHKKTIDTFMDKCIKAQEHD